MGEKMGVDAVESLVLQKLRGLLVDESFAGNKIIRRQLKRIQEDFKKTRSSLTAAAKERNDEEIKKLTRDYLNLVYCMEDSIETFALRFTRWRKRLGFLNKFITLKMFSCKLNTIRTKVKELDRRTSSLQGSRNTVKSPHILEPENADDGEQHEGGDDDDDGGDGVAEKMKQTSVSSTVPTTPGKPKHVSWTSPLNVLKRSDASTFRERMAHSKLMYSYSYNEEELSIVGYRRRVHKLLNRLSSTDDWIIPLVGKQGLGKTMLARAVYGNKTTTHMFEAVAWANIFKESNVTDILVSLLNQVKKSKVQDGSSSDEDLKSKLLMEFTGRRYLVVLDGVQTRDQWLCLKNAFPEQQNGSKIILTTCDKQVAEYDDQKWQPYYLKNLDSEESWTLFMRKVGLQEDPEDPDLKNRITEGCQGLPLNIVLLGSLLSMKDKGNWPKTLDTLSSPKNWQASDILKFSYNDLDIHLKLCLIYMTLFPKELDIPVRRLQRLWLAEGFVKQKQGEFQEDVAQKHFEDLVKRSLIMVSKQRSDGSPRKCRLLGALRDLLLAEAQDISLFHVHPGPDCQDISNRRLIEHAGTEPCPLEPSQSQLLRSYISFNFQKKDTPAKYVSSLVSKMVGKGLGLLRVLDLEGVYKPSLPENLGDLFHLRYLGLRWTFLDKLPKSVGELPFLETLDLKHTCIDKIPTSIWKLKNLQHLNLHEVHLDKDTPLHFSRSLPKLLTLWGLSVSHESPINNGLKKLEHLRELGISFRLIKRSDNTAEDSKSTSPAQSTEALVEWISQLKDLRSLRLRSIDDTGCPAHLSLKPFSKLKELSHMKLLGKLQQLPLINHFPPQIKVLTLSLSYLNEDPMPILGKLPYLTVLRLLGSSYLGDTIVCKRDTFENLEVLKLWVLEDLNKWEVEDGAMEKLKEVNIRRCCKLENFPSRLLQQKTFKELSLNDMPPAFKEKIDKNYQFKVVIKDFRTSES